MEWNEIKNAAYSVIINNKLSDEYRSRLDDEIKEIEKQGANSIWTDLYNKSEKFDDNPNGLVLMWLLGMTTINPIVGEYKIMIEASDGKEMEAIQIEDNGVKLVVSEHTLVKTSRGLVKACELCDTDVLV